MSTPADWRDRVDAAVAAAVAARRPLYGNPSVRLHLRSAAADLIGQAAAARGVSLTAFVRRSTLAMTAQVLEMPYSELILLDPTIQLAGQYFPAPDPSGRIGGPWEIESLRDTLSP